MAKRPHGKFPRLRRASFGAEKWPPGHASEEQNPSKKGGVPCCCRQQSYLTRKRKNTTTTSNATDVGPSLLYPPPSLPPIPPRTPLCAFSSSASSCTSRSCRARSRRWPWRLVSFRVGGFHLRVEAGGGGGRGPVSCLGLSQICCCFLSVFVCWVRFRATLESFGLIWSLGSLGGHQSRDTRITSDLANMMKHDLWSRVGPGWDLYLTPSNSKEIR